MALTPDDGGPPDPAALFDRYKERLRRTVRLRLDRRLVGVVDSSGVLRMAREEAAGVVGDPAGQPATTSSVGCARASMKALTGQTQQTSGLAHIPTYSIGQARGQCREFEGTCIFQYSGPDARGAIRRPAHATTPRESACGHLPAAVGP